MKILTSLACFFLATTMLAQLKHPKASSAATVTQEVGFTTIKVDYSRPAVRGRKIFGDLVPYSRIWRVGANESTKITFDTAFSVAGFTMPPGTYALYAFPEENEWEIVFHTNTTHWGDGRKEYNLKEDAFRTKVKPIHQEAFQESFLIAFDHVTYDSVVMIWIWENTRLVIPIAVDTKRVMEEQIHEQLNENPSAQTYYEIARYYVEQEIKYTQALEYLNKALELGGDTYYFYRVKSLAEAALKDYETAIASAQKSLELAKKQDKDEFVRMNQKNIVLWNEKLNMKN